MVKALQETQRQMLQRQMPQRQVQAPTAPLNQSFIYTKRRKTKPIINRRRLFEGEDPPPVASRAPTPNVSAEQLPPPASIDDDDDDQPPILGNPVRRRSWVQHASFNEQSGRNEGS